ncbi:hypothetical protein ACFSTI_15175 [Rhizorhabdus histidinilytica]
MQAHRIHDIADLRRRAARKLPRPIFDYIEGGAEDELALRDRAPPSIAIASCLAC